MEKCIEIAHGQGGGHVDEILRCAARTVAHDSGDIHRLLADLDTELVAFRVALDDASR